MVPPVITTSTLASGVLTGRALSTSGESPCCQLSSTPYKNEGLPGAYAAMMASMSEVMSQEIYAGVGVGDGKKRSWRAQSEQRKSFDVTQEDKGQRVQLHGTQRRLAVAIVDRNSNLSTASRTVPSSDRVDLNELHFTMVP